MQGTTQLPAGQSVLLTTARECLCALSVTVLLPVFAAVLAMSSTQTDLHVLKLCAMTHNAIFA